MSQSALGKLTTVGTEFNYWSASQKEAPTKRVSYLKHAKVIDVSDQGWVEGTYIVTAETEDEGNLTFRFNLENVDQYDIDWDTSTPERVCWSDSIGKAIRFLECLKPYSKNLFETSNEEHEQYDGLHSILRELRFFRIYLERNFPEGLGEK